MSHRGNNVPFHGIGLVALLVVIVGGAIGFRLATGFLKGKVMEAMGPESEIAGIQVGWSGLMVSGLRIRASQGWPATDALRKQRITLEDGVVELFDATVAQPPLKIRVETLQASVRNVLVPALTSKSGFDLSGILKGVRQDGRVKIGGWADVAGETAKGLGGAIQGLFGGPKKK